MLILNFCKNLLYQLDYQVYNDLVFSLSYLGAMQTPEAGADSTSTVPLQTTVPVQPTGSTQQVPVQQQVRPVCLVPVHMKWMFVLLSSI